MLTIQDKIERYNQILKQIAEHTIKSNDISDELFMLSQEEHELQEELINYIFKHKLYKPIKDLQKFEGKPLDSITLITKYGYIRDICNYNNITVINGHLYAENIDGDTLEYNPTEDKYVFTHPYTYDTLTIYACSDGVPVVGYINLRIADGLFEDILKDIATKEVV